MDSSIPVWLANTKKVTITSKCMKMFEKSQWDTVKYTSKYSPKICRERGKAPFSLKNFIISKFKEGYQCIVLSSLTESHYIVLDGLEVGV